MTIIKAQFPDILIIEPKFFGDNRGWFYESFAARDLPNIKESFVQDNHSFTACKNTIRGLHFQQNPHAQSKIVRCTRGAIKDVAVDIRRGSPNYKKWIAIELSAENRRQLYIPVGFAHGFVTLTDNVEIQYKVSDYYSPECDRNIRYDDPEIGIDWGASDFVLSEKDKNAPFLADCDCDFHY
jgi:dTDP-4-dehydrorhamnose 3,5-epimerase